MLSLGLAAGASALLVLPARPRGARRDSAGLDRAACAAWLTGVALRWPAAFAIVCAVPLAVARGPFIGAALALAVLVALRRWRAARGVRARTSATRRFAEALQAMVAELRRGAHPALAAASAAETPEVGSVFAGIADAAGIGARVEDTLAARAAELPQLTGELDRFASAWRLSVTHGLALAELLAALQRDVEHRVRSAANLRAQLSGARASGWVLASLPVAGVVLGQAIGADPLGVLGRPGAGGVLLLIGVGLICVGLTWTARLTERVLPC
ncbi:type II secretion system F family protein [Sciscionella sediminilitoris]|uniref:type II secretion system F family protein n=1 Tax=Sciscionella sediminilitoris TaxID=1445613 RepID=UPI00068BD101|nr:type II secretion system F family protein [Sciscionella sp. SE31]